MELNAQMILNAKHMDINITKMYLAIAREKMTLLTMRTLIGQVMLLQHLRIVKLHVMMVLNVQHMNSLLQISNATYGSVKSKVMDKDKVN